MPKLQQRKNVFDANYFLLTGNFRVKIRTTNYVQYIKNFYNNKVLRDFT